MQSPDTSISTVQLLPDVLGVTFEVVADNRCQLGGVGLRPWWNGSIAPTKTDDGRDGWEGKRLANELSTDEAGRAADYHFHNPEDGSRSKAVKLMTRKQRLLVGMVFS